MGKNQIIFGIGIIIVCLIISILILSNPVPLFVVFYPIIGIIIGIALIIFNNAEEKIEQRKDKA